MNMKFQKMFAALALSFAVIACSKEQAAPEEEATKPQEPQTEQTDVPEGYVRLTFSTPAQTKTSIDKESGAVSWSEHDQIKICWEGGSAVSDEVAIEGGVARFTADVSAEAEDLYAVYPSGIIASVSGETFSVDIPQSQSGRFADADIIVAKTTKAELTYAFHHAVSLVRFVISEGNSRNITRAQFVDLANNSCLYGTLGITFNGTDINSITEPTAEANDVIDITAVAEGDNWIAVPPTKSLTGYGLRMGTSSAWLPGIVGEKDYTFAAAGKRLGLGTVDSKINDGDWYITPDGGASTQDGKSWSTAYPAAMLSSLIHTAYVEKNLAKGWRINGKTIYVAGGEYSVPSTDGFTIGFKKATSEFPEGVTFTIEGGYSASGIKSPADSTIIGSRTTDTNKRAFFCYTGSNVTLKNLAIKHNTRMHNGGAVSINTTSAQIDGCTFEKNSNKAASDTRSGGALYCVSTGSIAIKDCHFNKNSAKHNGGAIYFDSSCTPTVKNCTFDGNSAEDYGGGVSSAVDVNYTSCIFTNNKAKGASAINAYKTNMYVDKCKFIGNHATNDRGSVIRCDSSGEAYFNDCEFRGNGTNNSSTVANIVYTTAATLGFNNCLFYNNTLTGAKSASWDIYTSKPLYVTNSTLFDSLSGTNASLIQSASSSSIVYNNILINNAPDKYGIRGSFALHDFNIVNEYYVDVTQNTNEVTASSLDDGAGHIYDTHAAGVEDGVSTGMSYYYWNGTSPTFVQTNKSAVSTALDGTAFLTWLDSLVEGADSALDYDIRGVKRSSGYWPGSYQNNL